MTLFVVAAALGAVARYMTDFYLPRYGILLVNTIGSYIAGLIFGLTLLTNVPDPIVHVVVGGLAGSLTTYSTVAVAAAEHRLERTGSATMTWLLHVGLSVAACLMGVFSVLVLG